MAASDMVQIGGNGEVHEQLVGGTEFAGWAGQTYGRRVGIATCLVVQARCLPGAGVLARPHLFPASGRQRATRTPVAAGDASVRNRFASLPDDDSQSSHSFVRSSMRASRAGTAKTSSGTG